MESTMSNPFESQEGLGQITLDYREMVGVSRWYMHAGEKNSAELNYIVLGIAGEAGETADQWKKITRKLGLYQGWELASIEDRMKLVHEAGDALWYIQAFCIMLGINLQELMLLNTIKLYERCKGTDKEFLWPLSDLSYADALSLMQRTVYPIIGPSVSPSTDTATS
jgi:NTP pyrophosphatase (non-canonical NTP hydrolase)